MNGGIDTCRTSLAEVARALQTWRISDVRDTTYQHISGCRRCQAGLLALIQHLQPQQGQNPVISCDESLVDLPAYIDLEQLDPAAAATTYPHVWWHLLTCERCVEMYNHTLTLLHHQTPLSLAPRQHILRRQARRVTPLRSLQLSRTMLVAALPVRSSALAITRGASDDGFVLYEDGDDDADETQLTIAVREQDDGRWQITVTVLPPPAGVLVLASGSARFTAPFDENGIAIIRDVDAAILSDLEAPPLEIMVIGPD
jgi:hypothetical protein